MDLAGVAVELGDKVSIHKVNSILGTGRQSCSNKTN